MTPTTDFDFDFDFDNDECDEIKNSSHIILAICAAAADTSYSLDHNPYNPYTEIRLHDEYNRFYRMAWLNRDFLNQTLTIESPFSKDQTDKSPEDCAELENEILAELE